MSEFLEELKDALEPFSWRVRIECGRILADMKNGTFIEWDGLDQHPILIYKLLSELMKADCLESFFWCKETKDFTIAVKDTGNFHHGVHVTALLAQAFIDAHKKGILKPGGSQ